MTAQPVEPAEGPDVGSYEMIHLGDQAAVVVPLADFLRLRVLEQRASAADLEDAEDAAALQEWLSRESAGQGSCSGVPPLSVKAVDWRHGWAPIKPVITAPHPNLSPQTGTNPGKTPSEARMCCPSFGGGAACRREEARSPFDRFGIPLQIPGRRR
jgi:hypothetical protein